jgi:methylmalonyl-CoA/ethylmalonyl-CoA epimerase
MAEQSIGLDTIGQIAVPIEDVERAVAFYRDALGMQHLFTIPNSAFFQCGAVRLMLARPERAEFAHPSSIIYFKVPDLDAAYREFGARGVRFEDAPHLIATMPDHDLWMCFFRDSEGNYMGLMSEVPRT